MGEQTGACREGGSLGWTPQCGQIVKSRAYWIGGLSAVDLVAVGRWSVWTGHDSENHSGPNGVGAGSTIPRQSLESWPVTQERCRHRRGRGSRDKERGCLESPGPRSRLSPAAEERSSGGGKGDSHWIRAV